MRNALSDNISYAVIDPKAYGGWDELLDLFEGLRNDSPVMKIENDDIHDPFWLVTRYEDVMRISKDNQNFLNNPRGIVFGLKAGDMMIKSITGGSPHLVNSLVALDAPIHPQYRRLTQEWFMPKSLSKLENELKALAKTTVDRWVDNGPEADFIPLVAAPYPLHVIMQILGVPEQDEQRMLFLTQQMFGGQDEDLNKSNMADMTPEQITQLVIGAVSDFEQYFTKLANEKRANPSDDVASIIANAKIPDENGDMQYLSDRDMAGYYIIIASAGHDTTSASVAGAMMALAKDPEQFARLKADRSLLAGIVEEAIRYTSPVQHFMRTAAADIEVGGVQISKGDWIMINYVSANHDERVFENPRSFDASRSPNRHLSFGAGAHQCLGLHMARMEMKILFNELLDRIETLELAGEPKRSNSTFVGGLKTLPLKFTTPKT